MNRHAEGNPICAAGIIDCFGAFFSVSVAGFCGMTVFVCDTLANAVSSQSGIYLISTTNPDGSPNTAYSMFAIKKVNDKCYCS